MPFRRITLTAQEQWFRQADAPDGERVPVRQGGRNEQICAAIAPLQGQLRRKDFNGIARALGLIIGSEAFISLTDAVGLDIPTAKTTFLDAGRWLLAGAPAELSERHTRTLATRSITTPE